MEGNQYLIHYGVLGMKWGRRRTRLRDAARQDRYLKDYKSMLSETQQDRKRALSQFGDDKDKMRRYDNERSSHISDLKASISILEKYNTTKYSDISEKSLAKGYEYLAKQDKKDRAFNQKAKKKYGW